MSLNITSKRTLTILGTVLVLLCIAIILVLSLSLTRKKNSNKENENYCAKGHEQYQSATESIIGKYKKAAVATDSIPCATIGKEILVENGSAVDAAIAAGLCNGLFNPHSCGIGGGFYMIIYLRESKQIIGIDAREKAPINAKEDMFVKNPKESLEGGLATAVPGELAGYWLAHKLAGRLPWKRLLQPSIDLCKNGIIVSPALDELIEYETEKIYANKGLADIFINKETNKTYKTNDTIKMPKLARTLEIVSEKGVDAFYNGELSEKIVRENKLNGGILTLEDLKNYNAARREVLNVQLSNKNYRVLAMPGSASGLLVSFIMNVMSQYNLTENIQTNLKDQTTFYHRLVETFKHTYAKRSYLGDIDFVNMTEITNNLTSQDYVSNIIKKIDDSKTFPESYYGPGWSGKTDHGTAHISVVAENGDAVSFTSTINTYFGALYGGEETGIIYNNEMDDFSTPGTINYFGVPASEANFIKAGKRPMSSMAPTIVLDDKDNARLVLGASGGTMITSSIALVALRNLYLGKNIKEAIDESRIHHQLVPPNIGFERGFPKELEDELIKKGHTVECFEYGGSIIQGIERKENGEVWANSDGRKGGHTDGY